MPRFRAELRDDLETVEAALGLRPGGLDAGHLRGVGAASESVDKLVECRAWALADRFDAGIDGVSNDTTDPEILGDMRRIVSKADSLNVAANTDLHALFHDALLNERKEEVSTDYTDYADVQKEIKLFLISCS